MNSSFFTSDRATHLKIGLTALLATALVVVVGVYARPVGGANGPAAWVVAGPTMVATAGPSLPQTR
jgi:hypothetical protein